MLSTVPVLFGSLALVFIASLLFVNALEWLGYRLKLGGSFVGAILSPVFTSLPELTVLFVAIFSSTGDAGQEIGIGTIFGEPFMISSLSYGLVGIAVVIGYFARRRTGTTLVIDKTLATPYIFIMVLFPLTLVPGFIHIIWVRYLFAALFLGIFVFYVWLMHHRSMTERIEEAEDLTLAKLAPRMRSHQMVMLALQLLVAVALLYFGSRYLVSSVATISQGMSLSPLGLAMIVIPAATAIPETITALIWAYRGKDTLAIGSLVGEKILYCTFYPAIGLIFTSWALDIHAISSVVVTTIISLILLYYVRRRRLTWYNLLVGLAFFAAYCIVIFLFRI